MDYNQNTISQRIKRLKEAGYKIFLVGFFAFLFFFFHCPDVQTATLRLSPSSGSYASGKQFTVSIVVSSTDQPMNAVSAHLVFPTDLLSVSSLSKDGSIINFWVQQPTFSNNQGTIDMEGVALNPGYQGNSGKIVTITFRGKKAGDAEVYFSEASVLANDGVGTELLKSLSGGTFKILPPQTSVSLSINSNSHPSQDRWYSATSAVFSWNLVSSVNAVRFSLSESQEAPPSSVFEPPISSTSFLNINQGIQYFSLQPRTAEGWGAITRYRIQSDTEPPDPFTIHFEDDPQNQSPTPILSFSTTDRLSGISIYEIYVDGNMVARISPEQMRDNRYQLSSVNSGKHILIVQAIDQAGNMRAAQAEFVVTGIATPGVEYYESEKFPNEYLVVKGTAVANGSVLLFVKNHSGKVSTSSAIVSSEGKFTVVSQEPLSLGVYDFWLIAEWGGSISGPTDLYRVVVKQGWLWAWILIITFLIIVAFLLFWIANLKDQIRRLKREVSERDKSKNEKKEFSEKGIEELENTKKIEELCHFVKEELQKLENTSRYRYLTPEERNLTERLREILQKRGYKI